jgi:hypothetical protein
MDKTAKFILVTPKMAARWLEQNNTANYRHLDKNKVKFYAEKMTAGYWQSNGEAIQFGEDGTLKNGQHRLAAIVQSNCPQEILVVTGIKDEDSHVYDSGKTRSWSDYTSAANHGARISTSIGGAIQCFLSNFGANGVISNEAKLDYYLKHKEDLETALLYCARGSQQCIMKKSGCIAAIYCAIRLAVITPEMAEVFCKIVNSGFPEHGWKSEPALSLRKTIQSFTMTGGAQRQRIAFDVTYQAIIAFKRGLVSKRCYKESGNVREIISAVMILDREVTA